MRNASIDYLKAIAILFVIITHSYSRSTHLSILGPFYIDMAVLIFIIITGYNYVSSEQKKGFECIRDGYKRESIISKIRRLLEPYIIVLTIQSIWLLISGDFTVLKWVIGTLTGGWGPGSYYLPVLLQIFIVAPICLFYVKKSPTITLIMGIVLASIFEFLATYTNMSNAVYRLIGIRYLPFMLVGMILCLYKDKIRKNSIIVASVLSYIYILVVNYTEYKPIIFTHWTHTALPTIGYAVGLVFLGMRYLKPLKCKVANHTISTIGRASYHIFFTQMVYFWVGVGNAAVKVLGNLVGISVNILICIIVGTIFYRVEGIFANCCINYFKVDR